MKTPRHAFMIRRATFSMIFALAVAANMGGCPGAAPGTGGIDSVNGNTEPGGQVAQWTAAWGSSPEDVFVVKRHIAVELDAPKQKAFDPNSMPLTGTYRETLSGLHRLPVSVAGRFELRRVATTATLGQ